MSETTSKIGNWGRWGEADERGTLNLLTPEVVLRAVGVVKRGVVYSLGMPIRRTGVPVAGVRNPPLHFMSWDGGDFAAGARAPDDVQSADDYLIMACHGGTHIDALSHTWAQNRLYNGFSGNDVRSTGARHCDIAQIGSIVARGVLLDIAATRGLPHLPKGYPITPADLEACLESQGTRLEPGDAVLVRTGWRLVWDRDPAEYNGAQPGINTAAARWLADRDVCLIGADNMAVECLPWEGGRVSPVHVEILRNRGAYLLELLDLEALAADRVHEFLFVLNPLKIVGGVGSPVNPVAIA